MQKKMMKIIMTIVFAIMVCLTGCEKEAEMELETVAVEELEEEGVSGEEAAPLEETVFIHVCGEVASPGVYELKAGSRVYEAIEAAGGLTPKAAEEALNQAEVLVDGQQIQVLSLEEILQKDSADGKININKAAKEELMTLSGIGEAKADAIIRYRNEKGKFDSIEEIMEIEGIKEGVFRKIEDLITVS